MKTHLRVGRQHGIPEAEMETENSRKSRFLACFLIAVESRLGDYAREVCMKLYFVRHVDALPGADDAARPLSERGQDQARKLGGYLKDLGVAFEAAYTSPLARARQTAELIVKRRLLARGAKLAVTDALLNDTSKPDFERWLSALPRAGCVLLVGHAPSLDEHLAALLGVAEPDTVALRKCALAVVAVEAGQRATLKLFLSPKYLA
jgi:phosphohistidine phosphatase